MTGSPKVTDGDPLDALREKNRELRASLEAAEAEVARLREGLRALANPDGIVRAGDPAGIRIPPHEFARALLAEDGAA